MKSIIACMACLATMRLTCSTSLFHTILASAFIWVTCDTVRPDRDVESCAATMADVPSVMRACRTRRRLPIVTYAFVWLALGSLEVEASVTSGTTLTVVLSAEITLFWRAVFAATCIRLTNVGIQMEAA